MNATMTRRERSTTTYTIDNPVKTLTVHESSHGKTPGCYVNKTFVLTYTGSTSTYDPQFGEGGFDSYDSTLKNGKPIRFTFYKHSKTGPKWFVRKEDCFAGSWLYEVTEAR